MKKILLIEDNVDIRENTAEILELASYEVITAENGKDGVNLAMKNKPDLIICDIMMPVLDGYGVLHLLSKNQELSSIPFIFMTAKSDRADFRKGMEMGADDYITKPFDDIELLNAIEARLKKSEIIKKEFSKDIEGLNSFITDVKGLNVLEEISHKEDADTRVCKKKEVVYAEGSYPKGIFFLLKGKVKTYKTNDQGKEFITDLYKEGDFFGYSALFEDEKYTDSATALEDVKICLIPKDEFFALMFKNIDVSKKFIHLLSNNLKEKEDKLIKLAYNSVRKRVAEALTTLSKRYNEEGKDGFTMSISREDLANLAGTATETTIRTLSDFKEEGLITIEKGAITLVDIESLSSMRN
jgi:CRP-like cAMP-binding protein/AmiR/NasT family two-component response regulator